MLTSTKKIALCGVLSALAISIMFILGLTGVGVYIGPVISSCILFPILSKFGPKTALLSYLVIAILCLILIPDKEQAIFFCCFGWYPVALVFIDRIKSRALRILIKFSVYSAIVAIMYGFLLRLLGIDPKFSEMKIINITFFSVGAICFIMLDFIYIKAILLWKRISKRI